MCEFCNEIKALKEVCEEENIPDVREEYCVALVVKRFKNGHEKGIVTGKARTFRFCPGCGSKIIRGENINGI